jgi:hypothetical protein
LVNGGYGNANRSRLLRNDVATGGGFVDVSDAAGLITSNTIAWGASFGDFDNDGYLDLVVPLKAHGDHPVGGAQGVLDPPSPIFLYHNTGRGTFVEKGESLNLRAIFGDTKNPVWFDYDEDGDLDLYVAGFNDHALFRNDGDIGFTEVTDALLTPLGATPPVFSAAAEDFDQDGRVDLYLGRWDRQGLLMRNKGDGTFEALGREIGIDMFAVQVTPPGEISGSHENTMASAFADIDANGYPDIIIGPGTPIIANPAVVLCNEGSPLRFNRCMPDIVKFGPSRNHGIAFADFDHDGDLDIFFNRGGAADFDDGTEQRPATPDATAETASFYVNYPPEPPHTAALRLRGTVSNRDAVGAKIVIAAAEGTRYHWVRSQQAFVSQDSPWYLALVGEAGAEATIYWPSGIISTVNLLPGQRVDVVEPR